jgi:hypothetical protein
MWMIMVYGRWVNLGRISSDDIFECGKWKFWKNNICG